MSSYCWICPCRVRYRVERMRKIKNKLLKTGNRFGLPLLSYLLHMHTVKIVMHPAFVQQNVTFRRNRKFCTLHAAAAAVAALVSRSITPLKLRVWYFWSQVVIHTYGEKKIAFLFILCNKFKLINMKHSPERERAFDSMAFAKMRSELLTFWWNTFDATNKNYSRVLGSRTAVLLWSSSV